MCPINVECFQQAFYIDWVFFEEFVASKNLCTQSVQNAENLINMSGNTFCAQSMQNACKYLCASILHILGTILETLFIKSNLESICVPSLCRMLAYTYLQAFYTDWVHCVYPICVECLQIGICKHSTQTGYITFGILHNLGTFSNFQKCTQFVQKACAQKKNAIQSFLRSFLWNYKRQIFYFNEIQIYIFN